MTTSTIIKPNVSEMTVADLKEFCIRKGIPIKGLKRRLELLKAIESHTLTPIKITSAEADLLLQKSEPQPEFEIQDKGWRDCLQYDDAGNCITQAQILTPQHEKYIGQICSVVVATSAIGAVLEAADGQKMLCCYPDEFKLVTGFSHSEYWECQNDYGVWVEFAHIDSNPAPHRKRRISRSEYDRRTQPPQPQGHNVMPNSGAGGGDKKPPLPVATGGSDEGEEKSDTEKLEADGVFFPASKWTLLPLKSESEGHAIEVRNPLKLNCDRVPEHFGDRTHKADDSGQLSLLELNEDDAPDPDDFPSQEAYAIAWDKWKAKHPEVKESDDYPPMGSRRFAAEVNLIDELLVACKQGDAGCRPAVERPIIFSAPMVRAILSGKKTQTRRLVIPQPQTYGPELWLFKENEDSAVVWQCSEPPPLAYLANLCPYGTTGDRLWVREAFAFSEGDYIYRASGEARSNKWKPSIHMPREASRLTLQITDVRIEQLQDISEEDALSEGVRSCEDFERLWDSIYPEADWQSNPWVWVVDFIKVDCPTPKG